MSLLYTDRSRYERGLKHCMVARFNEYEREGTGIRAIAQSLYPTTGKGVHQVMDPLMRYAMQNTRGPSRDEAREMVTNSLLDWKEEVRKTSLREVAPEHLEFIINEQGSLVEGFFWCFWRGALDQLLQEFTVVAVEHEESFVVGCTCGIGDQIGEPDDHEGKGCNGLCILSRPDFALAARANGSIKLVDFKTTGGELETRDNEHILQVIFGSVGMERRLGVPVQEHYFIGLHKGARRPNKQGIKEQGSPLCYGYYRAPVGHFDEGHWEPHYTRASGYLKTPVWAAFFPTKPGEMSNSEFVCNEILTLEDCRHQVSLLGPMSRPEYLTKKILVEVEAHEREWEQRRVAVAAGAAVSEVVAASWDCYQFFGGQCEFVDLCHQNAPEHENPLSNDSRWERRTENHPMAERNWKK